MRLPVISLCLGALALVGCEAPQIQKLADCRTNSLNFPMTVQNSAPYQFVLGVPRSQTGQLSFRGVIVLQQSTGVVARVEISSRDVTPCNWLPSAPDLSGYILTWSRTNHGERLSDLLVEGQTYNVRVTFEEPPPASSTLWLSSIKH
jgi:hypothetical protein